jgi:hypothetical protein
MITKPTIGLGRRSSAGTWWSDARVEHIDVPFEKLAKETT